MNPKNFTEYAIWYTLLGTYGFYLIGGLYIAGSVIGWILLIYLGKKLWSQTDATPLEEKITIPWITWTWIGGMLVMELALIVAHLTFDLGAGLLIKSSIGWMKGWALLAVFPVIGSLKIRPQILYRAACILCLQTLIFFPIFVLAYLLHLPDTPYVSPLKVVGGPGPEFFALSLYEIDPSNGLPRWRLFTPWAPALGFMGNIYFFLSLQEKNNKWRAPGIAGAVLMSVVSSSRLAVLCMPVVLLINWVLTNFARPVTMMILGFVSLIVGISASFIASALEIFSERFKAARANSSIVRETLGRIALDRWQNEAPVWGHGIVEEGPKIVEHMPIGSHHTWYGLLFVKGIVGVVALAVPMLCSFFYLVIKAQENETAKVSLAMVIILFLYTFGENLEILAYLIWPALLCMGIAFNDKTTSANNI